MTLFNTSTKCWRSVAVTLAWAELGLLVLRPLAQLGGHDDPFQAAHHYSFAYARWDLFAVAAVRTLLVMGAGCSNGAAKTALAFNVAIAGFVAAKVYDNSATDANATFNLATAAVAAVFQLALSLAIFTGLPTTTAASTKSEDFPESTVSTPLVQSTRSPAPPAAAAAIGASKNGLAATAAPTVAAKTLNAAGDVFVDNTTLNFLTVATMPIRIFFYCLFMALMLPLALVRSFWHACYLRCTKGKASDMLHKLNVIEKPMGGYACQMVFDKPLKPDRLREVVNKLAAECGIDASFVRIDFEDSSDLKTDVFPAEAAIADNHYVPEGWIKSVDTLMIMKGKDAVLWLKVWNGRRAGVPTVLHMRLPGDFWDGTSCFNFTKEMCNRYAGGTHTDIFKDGQLMLSPEVKRKFDQFSFLQFLFIQQPFAVCFSVHRFAWRFGAAIFKCCGGPLELGDGGVAAVLNFNEEDSTRFARGAKAKGIKPFAAMNHAVMTAHTKVVGFQANRIIMQASLQNRAYLPRIPERNIVGDWLVGPVQRVGRAPYTLEQAQSEYDKLIMELTDFPANGEIAKTFNAKAYGFAHSGASMFEMHPCYPYDAGVWGPSVFFNNYGLRQINEDMGIVSWNWCAPYYLGCNAICINGKNSIALASLCLSRETVGLIRDQMEIEMRRMMTLSA